MIQSHAQAVSFMPCLQSVLAGARGLSMLD